MAYTAIVGNPDLLLSADVEKAVIEAFWRNPEPLLAALGMAPDKPGKTFVEIMTKPCALEKQAKHIGFKKHSKPIGFALETPEKHQSLCSVGFAPNPPSFPDNSTAPDDTSTDDQDDNSNNFTRCHDDTPTEYWDSDLGEFRKLPTAKPSTVRSAAVKEVERGLARLSQHHGHG